MSLQCSESALPGALAVEAARVTTLLRSLHAAERDAPRRDPGRSPVVGQWDLAEVAAHLSHVWTGLPGLARRDLSEIDALVPDRGAGDAIVADISRLPAFTAEAVRADPERDLAVLADRIETRSAGYLADRAADTPADAATDRPWLVPGVRVPPSVITGHLLNETVVHGWDLARAAGRPWRIDPVHASLVVREWMVPVMLAVGPQVLAGPAGAGAYGRYLLRVRGGKGFEPEEFPLELGADGMRPGGPGRVDCRMSVDPVGFLLLFFGRIGVGAAVARGKMLVWGRKPWLAARLHAALPSP